MTSRYDMLLRSEREYRHDPPIGAHHPTIAPHQQTCHTCALRYVQATVVGFGEEGALLHVDVAASDGRPITLTAVVPLAELSWKRLRSAQDAVQVRLTHINLMVASVPIRTHTSCTLSI